MELIYFFSFIWRNIVKILVGSCIIAVLAAGYSSVMLQDTYNSTIIFQTTTKVDTSSGDIDPLSSFEAADRFSEAILGWFRNPIIFEQMAENVEGISGGELSKIFKIRRQEKQNLNITFNVANTQLAKELQDSITSYMNNKVASINEASNSSYELVNFDYAIDTVSPSTTRNTLFGCILGFFALSILFLMTEFFSGKVMYKELVDKEMGATSLYLPNLEKQSAYLGELLTSLGPVVALVSIGFTDAGATKQLATHLAGTDQKKTLLIDGDISGDLTKHVIDPTSKTSFKGFFDNQTSLEKAALVLEKQQPQLHFIGNGAGAIPSYTALGKLSDSFDAVILHTTLPGNEYFYQLKNIPVVAMVSLSQSTRMELAKLRKIRGENLTLVSTK